MATDVSELILEGRALVRSIALRIVRNLPVRLELDDLIGYGELGLAEAARDFDPELGNQFTTFAYYRIRGAIYDGVAKMTWCSRARYRRMVYEQMANQVLENERDRGDSESFRDHGAWFARTTESLAVVYLASGIDSESDILEDAASSESDPVERVLSFEASANLRESVKKLPFVESKIINMVYFEGYTLQQAADAVGCSKSWASRLHAKALEQLASEMKRVGLS